MRLDQYAGICAALTEGFSLPAALANDDIDLKTWQRSAPAWAAKLARQKVGTPLHLAYMNKLAEAETWLGRRVEPLGEDIESWISFLGAWSSDSEPRALLPRLGIRASDIAHITTAWSTRIESDERLKKRAQKIASGRPTRLPAVRCIPARLRPFPWSRQPGPVGPPTPAAERILDTTTDTPRVEVVTPSYLQQQAPKVVQSPSATTPTFGQTVDAFHLPGSPALPFPPPTKVPSAPRTFGETVDVLQFPASAPLPFSPGESPSPPQAKNASEPAPRTFSETIDVFQLPEGPLLPFSAEKGPPQTKNAHEPAPRTFGETIDVFQLRDGPALPFSDEPRGAGDRAPDRPFPSSNPEPTPLRGQTAALFGLSSMPELPFLPDKAAALMGDSPNAKNLPTPTAKSPSSGESPTATPKQPAFGKMMVAFQLPASFVSPFGRSVAPAAPGKPNSPDATAPQPAGSPAKLEQKPLPVQSAPAPAPVPALTLQQHASLTAELAVFRGRETEVLARYGVSSDLKNQLDRHYADLGVSRPEARTAWEQAYRTYHQWLVSQPRGRR